MSHSEGFDKESFARAGGIPVDSTLYVGKWVIGKRLRLYWVGLSCHSKKVQRSARSRSSWDRVDPGPWPASSSTRNRTGFLLVVAPCSRAAIFAACHTGTRLSFIAAVNKTAGYWTLSRTW